MKNKLFLLLIVSALCSCQKPGWFEGSLVPDEDKVDVFYIVSTEVQQARRNDGSVCMRSLLTAIDTAAMNDELRFVRDSIFHTDFNFIAPYYHQYTMESLLDYPEAIDSVRTEVGQEICKLFDWYMNHVNHGRNFILAGFSQGGDMVMHILRHMSPDQYSHMVAAYVMGYKVTARDTAEYPTICPARGADDTGVVIAYNSVLRQARYGDYRDEVIRRFVTDSGVVCINPVCWTTEDSVASFMYNGRLHTLQVDPDLHVLMVDADSSFYPHGLHVYDLLFFTRFLHENALVRCSRHKQ